MMQLPSCPLSERQKERIPDCVDYVVIRNAAIDLVQVVYDEALRLFPDNDEKTYERGVWVFNSLLMAILDLTHDSFLTEYREGAFEEIGKLLEQSRED